MARLPEWSRGLIELYESRAASQFVLYGNVQDRMLLPRREGLQLGGLDGFLADVLLKPFDVVLGYDLGHGLRVEKGNEKFAMWPSYNEGHTALPKKPREAIETMSHYVRYLSNVRRVSEGKGSVRVALIIRSADMVLPVPTGTTNYELNAMALLVKEWSTDAALREHPLASFLVVENVNDLHPMVANHPRTARVRVPLPSAGELEKGLRVMEGECADALKEFRGEMGDMAEQLVGATMSSVESLLLQRQHRGEALVADDLADLKKELVERDCQDLIEFVKSDRKLDFIVGQEPIKKWMRGDIRLWKQGDLKAMPMGYLLCGPVGTGKTFLVECLAGEAGVPVVKMRNFRDRWVGSTEGNLEKIFRLLEALGRCIVFVDEADQALGRRNAGSGDSGVSGRVYSMMAKQMSDTRNRGKILWILASSRPDMIEVDLKRPGRVDIKLPLFPTVSVEEGFELIRALMKKQGLDLAEDALGRLRELIPDLVTPGAAEALAVKCYRIVQTENVSAEKALRDCLDDYQSPIPREVMEFQIGLAVREASDLDYVPERFREFGV